MENNRIAEKREPVSQPDGGLTVQPLPGYNSWSFIQPLRDRWVCVYSRGEQHDFSEPGRGVYARISTDAGRSWSAESPVVNSPDGGDSAIGKGLDGTGAMLVWVRHAGPTWRHELYRTADGVRFRRIAQLEPDPMPMQITDVFAVPGVGLMSLWFAGNYREGATHSWGTLVSGDDGRTWRQRTVEDRLEKRDWPTEPSAVYLGDGRILAVTRVEGRPEETGRAQFQLGSSDFGRTWTRARTNITDVQESTPSLIFDRGRLFCYYFQRGAGLLKCRTADPEAVRADPLAWSAPEVVALGSREWHHAGNVNAAPDGDRHCLTFYSGDEHGTEVRVKVLDRG